MNRDSNRFKVDALLAVSRLTANSELRERVLEEVLELLNEADIYVEANRGRPNFIREEVAQNIFDIVSRNETSSKELKDALTSMGYSRATIRRAIKVMVEQGILKVEHRGFGAQHECYYNLEDAS